MARLRAKDGCPWDKAQTHRSLLPFLIEEAYEVLETIEEHEGKKKCSRKFADKLKEELGDLLLQIFFHAQIAKENKLFGINDILKELINKIIRRHPHIFDKKHKKLKTPAQVRETWEEIKLKEKSARVSDKKSGKTRKSLLDGIPKQLPALLYAERLQGRAAEVGFDWDDIKDVIKKMKEEEKEFQESFQKNDKKAVKEELGDMLFALANLCRFADINAEEALRLANKKFEKRFKHIEDSAERENKKLREMSLAEMDKLWNEAKDKGIKA